MELRYATLNEIVAELQRRAVPKAPGSVLELSVDVLRPQASIRLRKLLMRSGAKTLQDVIKYSREELLEFKNVGKTTLDSLERHLAHFGLKLKP